MISLCRKAPLVLAGWLASSAQLAVAQDASSGSAQSFPSKPVRIVTGGVGGAGDFAARLVGQGLGEQWGRQVIVDNRPNGPIPGEVVARSSPDGYTLLTAVNLLWIGHLLQNNEPYDPVRDFAPVTLAAISPNVLVIHPSLPVKTVKELISLARSRPAQLNFGTGATGSASHLAAELFKSMARVNMVRIPYKSNASQIADLIGGHIQMMFSASSAVGGHITTGRLRALAVTGSQRAATFPDLPTVAAAGLPGYEAVLHVGLFAPSKISPLLLAQINQDAVRVLARPDIREKLLNAGMEAAGGSSAQFGEVIKTDIARWGKVIKEAGIRAD